MTLDEMHDKIGTIWPGAKYTTFYRGDHLMHEWTPANGAQTRFTAPDKWIEGFEWPEHLTASLRTDLLSA